MRPVARPNAPHALLLQRVALLAVIVFCAVFFSTHKMFFLCLFLIPLLYLLSMTAYPENPSQCYENVNNREHMNEILDALPVQDVEAANWMSKMFSVSWPHMFMQERVDKFKEGLQAALDANTIPYFRSIEIVSLEIGDRAPQITQVKIPEKPEAAEDSVLYQVSMLYYPEFKLKCLVTPRDVPAFHVTFTDPSFDMEWYMQFEFCPKPYIEGIPFMTAAAFSLVKKPNMHRDFFKVTLFTSSNLFNRDSIKKHMGDRLADAMWNIAGFPNGMVYDRVRGIWRMEKEISTKKMRRTSMTTGELLRYSRIKSAAMNFCKELKLPEPMTVKVIAHKDQETSSYHLTLLSTLSEDKSIDNIKMIADEFSVHTPSQAELELFLELSYEFLIAEFTSKTTDILERQKRASNPALTKRFEEEVLAPVYVYVNFLSLQIKVNADIAEKLQLASRVARLEKMIMGFHNKIYKMTQ